MSIKVLLADDERLFRQSLKILLETGTDLRVVADAGDGQEAVTGARETSPDLALLDVDMPKMDGVKACRLISAMSPRTKILMLSVHHEEEKIRAAIRAGALGYILKDTDREEFIKIIRKTHAGRIPASPYLAHLALERPAEQNTASNQDRHGLFLERFALTTMELKILRLLIEGLSNEEIGQITHLARETIKGHLKSLFRKLEVKNRTEAAVLGVREGMG
ncbi:MAG TPA: response regulator transcription factor [Terriglobales bacterium]|jgi:DNA-binding NarL/FixJ family response regulator|nr:response regulator transcription factor [Terriglobales bacterium]